MNLKLPQLLNQLAKVREAQLPLLAQLGPLQEQETALRKEITAAMTERGIRTQVDEQNRFTASLAMRHERKVVDEAAVIAALSARQKLEACMRLDLAAVKKEDKEEALPGMEAVETSVLSIRESAE